MRKALLFPGILNDADVNWAVTNGTARQVTQRVVLIREGTFPDSILLVLNKRLSVRISSLNGRKTANPAAGEIIGEMPFVASRPPGASVLALAVARHLLVERFGECAPFAARSYSALATFLADRMRNRVASLAYHSGEKLDAERVYKDEIDPERLDAIALAAARLEWILKRLGAGCG